MPLDPEELLLEELLELLLEELLELLEELLEEDEEEALLNPDEDEEEDELLELPEDDVSSPPPQATKVSANRHELAIVTGRRQSTNVFIEDIFTYLFLVTHIVS
ncbi:MAG: hypothetical protein NVV73_11215 [Cellvibrionaceae bacterium]|nr:hypothetical protein [Cellvibrionaceae bacterium]